METSDREWLRANRHRIKIGQTDAGLPLLDFDDYNVFDAMDDFLTEDCEEILGKYVFLDQPGSWQIVFVEPAVALSQLEEIIARI